MKTEDLKGIYTIGYGNIELGRWVELLKKYKIQYLIDIRSRPFSSYRPEFSRPRLSKFLSEYKIKYIFMGDKLGGQPQDDECYDKIGRILYTKYEENTDYILGIKRLIKNLDGNIRLCLMCAESKPEECHRSKLIGETLFKMKINVWHILSDGHLENHDALRSKIFGMQIHIFEEYLTSRHKYPAKPNE